MPPPIRGLADNYLYDPVLLDYLQSIWQPLLREARSRGNEGVFTVTAALESHGSALAREALRRGEAMVIDRATARSAGTVLGREITRSIFGTAKRSR